MTETLGKPGYILLASSASNTIRELEELEEAHTSEQATTMFVTFAPGMTPVPSPLSPPEKMHM